MKGRRAERRTVREMKQAGLREATIFAPEGEQQHYQRHMKPAANWDRHLGRTAMESE